MSEIDAKESEPKPRRRPRRSRHEDKTEVKESNYDEKERSGFDYK